MNLIELHILQSYPVTCLNRDDLGAPKSAMFGGVMRARISSQCLKRPTRELMHATNQQLFAGVRTKLLGPMLLDALKSVSLNAETVKKDVPSVPSLFGETMQANTSLSEDVAQVVADYWLAQLKKDDKIEGAVKTLIFLSPEELKKAVEACVNDKEMRKILSLGDLEAIKSTLKVDEGSEEEGKEKKSKKGTNGPKMKKLLEYFGQSVKDAADIAIFGRMVADDASLTVEGASMFSHALSTHAVRSELDFFSAVDEGKCEDATDAGAGQIGTIEYNSACYYRYVALNLDQLKKSDFFDESELKNVVEVFLESCIKANPSARKNSMCGMTLPSYVMALRREGQPISLANAFETPIKKSFDGYVGKSIDALKKEWEAMKSVFGVSAIAEYEFGKGVEGTDMKSMLNKMLEQIG